MKKYGPYNKDVWFISNSEIVVFDVLHKGITNETILDLEIFESEDVWKQEVEKRGLRIQNSIERSQPKTRVKR
jgi:hypothetical protein